MAWIRTVPPDEARGLLAEQYEAAVARAGRVYQIVQSMSLAPGILDVGMGRMLPLTRKARTVSGTGRVGGRGRLSRSKSLSGILRHRRKVGLKHPKKSYHHGDHATYRPHANHLA